MARGIRSCDQGTDYARALLAYDRTGASRATDEQLMAAFCEDDLQVLMGAFSPRLVWEGAQARGMTTLQLANLCAPGTAAARRKANAELDCIQFDDSARYKPQGGTR